MPAHSSSRHSSGPRKPLPDIWVVGSIAAALVIGVSAVAAVEIALPGNGGSDTKISTGAEVPSARVDSDAAARAEGESDEVVQKPEPPSPSDAPPGEPSAPSGLGAEPQSESDPAPRISPTPTLSPVPRPAPTSNVASVLGAPAASVPGAPAPAPAPAPASLRVIQDTNRGTGWNEVQADGTWKPCTTTCHLVADGSYLWSSTTGAKLTVRFTGRSIVLYGVTEPWSHYATVSIDGAAPVTVDFYTAPQRAGQVFRSPDLAPGEHALVLTMSPHRNPASTGGDAITFDRAEVGG